MDDPSSIDVADALARIESQEPLLERVNAFCDEHLPTPDITWPSCLVHGWYPPWQLECGLCAHANILGEGPNTSDTPIVSGGALKAAALTVLIELAIAFIGWGIWRLL